MDNEMIERCAKAMADYACVNYDHNKEIYVSYAIRTINAMRAPTEKMNTIVGPDMPAGGSVIEVWQDVIDSILND